MYYTVAAIGLLFGAGFFGLALRDPFRAFLYILPMMVVTRSVSLPYVADRISPADFLLLLWWLALITRRVYGHRGDLCIPKSAFAPSIIYHFLLASMLLSLMNPANLWAGIETMMVYAFLGVWGASTLGIVNSEERVERIIRTLMITFSAVNLLALWEAFLIPVGLPPLLPLEHASRITATFRNPNQLGTYVVMMLPVAWSRVLFAPSRPRARWWMILNIACGLVVLALTSSRANIAVAILQYGLLSVAVLFLRRESSFRRLLVWSLPAAAAVVLGMFILPEYAPRYWTTLATRSQPYLLELASSERPIPSPLALLTAERTEFTENNWTMPVDAFLANPISGVGIGNFGEKYSLVSTADGTEVHSQYLGFLAEIGAVGFGLLILFLIVMTDRSIRLVQACDREIPASTWIAAGILVTILSSLVGGVYIRFLRRRELWLMFGLVLAHPQFLGVSFGAENRLAHSLRAPGRRAAEPRYSRRRK